MSKLVDLIEAVKEKNLSKQQLEDYHTELTSLFGSMHLELAELEKSEALYILASGIPSAIGKKNAWKGTEKGQRDIELGHFTKATEKVLSSLKNRMYSQY